MASEQCFLEHGYFVCAKKAAFQSQEVLAALLGDGGMFENGVGKMSCLNGVTLPSEIPVSPAFIVQDGDGFTITPGAWSPLCPILYGTNDLLPNNKELLKHVGQDENSSVIPQEEILKTARNAKNAIKDTVSNRWTHITHIEPVMSLTQEEIDNLFNIFNIPADSHHEHMIYMINSLHGTASVALGEIKIATNKKMHLDILQFLRPYCQNVNPADFKAQFVPYYSTNLVGGDASPSGKAYIENLGEISDKSLSDFTELGEMVPCPEIAFMKYTCASDVFKLFPGSVDGVTDAKDILELYRAIVLGVPGKYTTSSGQMDPFKYNIAQSKEQGEISKAGLDVGVHISVATLYTAQVHNGLFLEDYQPRKLHMINMIERLEAIRNSSHMATEDDMFWEMRTMIDDVHSIIISSYLDTGSAINRTDYDLKFTQKTEKLNDPVDYAEKNYVSPLINMPKSEVLDRLWFATGGDIVLYTMLIRAVERDVSRCRGGTYKPTDYMFQCMCDNQFTCIHKIVTDWLKYTKFNHVRENQTAQVTSASEGMYKRIQNAYKRDASGSIKGQKKAIHDSMFTGFLRCVSSNDLAISPFGKAMVGPSSSDAEKDCTKDGREQNFSKKKNLAAIQKNIMKSLPLPIEESNVFLEESGMGAGKIAIDTTMASLSRQKLYKLMFNQPHEDEKTSTTVGHPKKNKKQRAMSITELTHVVKKSANTLLDTFTTVLRKSRNDCLDTIKKFQSPIQVDSMWKLDVRYDPNLEQYNAVTAPLFTSTLIDMLRPPIFVLKAHSLLFPQIGFMKKFPYYDRTKLESVLGQTSQMEYGMDGKFLPPQPEIFLFTHSNTPTCVPCIWNGTVNQRISVKSGKVRGTMKHHDKRLNYGEKQGENGTNESSTDTAHKKLHELDNDGDSDIDKLKKLMYSSLAFELDDDDDMTYEMAVKEIESLMDMKHTKKTDIESWMGGSVTATVLKHVGPRWRQDFGQKKDDILSRMPKWRYVSAVLRFLWNKYTPESYFIPGTPEALPAVKYITVYMALCRTFKIPADHVKPKQVVCMFPTKCVKRQGRVLNPIYNYDMLLSNDAPYLSMSMDYSFYGSAHKKGKVFGGPVLKNVHPRESGLLSTAAIKSFYYDRKNIPYGIIVTPCIPFPESGTKDKTISFLQGMSFEEILDRIECEQMANAVVRTCGYDSVLTAVNTESDEFNESLCNAFSFSHDESSMIVQFLKSSVMVENDSDKDVDEDSLLSSDDETEVIAKNARILPSLSDAVKMYE